MKKEYLPRIADKALELYLECSGAVLIEGLKWCGKSRTAEEKAKSAIYLQDPDNREHYEKVIGIKSSLLLEGETPRLIDEWQDYPSLWDAVRFAVDRRGEVGQFILTGSAVPTDNATKHTGTGRINRFIMRTMSLFESKESNGRVSLRSLFDGADDIEGVSTITIEQLAFIIARGGWPASIGANERIALQNVYNYCEAVINHDINRVDGVNKKPQRVRALMKSYARHISTMATAATIMADVLANDVTISDKTMAVYLNALECIHVIEELPAWSPKMRSSTTIRTCAKRHYADPAIAIAMMSGSPKTLLGDFNTFGLLFESLCVRDLRVYSQGINGDVFYYHDKYGLEADAIVHLHDGRWAGVEVKMGQKEIDEGVAHLLKLREKVDTEKMGPPSFLMVLTAGEYAYRRPDGVFVVPIGCLRD